MYHNFPNLGNFASAGRQVIGRVKKKIGICDPTKIGKK